MGEISRRSRKSLFKYSGATEAGARARGGGSDNQSGQRWEVLLMVYKCCMWQHMHMAECTRKLGTARNPWQCTGDSVEWEERETMKETASTSYSGSESRWGQQGESSLEGKEERVNRSHSGNARITGVLCSFVTAFVMVLVSRNQAILEQIILVCSQACLWLHLYCTHTDLYFSCHYEQ